MATTYTGLRVQDTYKAIIKIGDNTTISSTAKLLSDGLGNDSPLYLSGTRLGIGISPAYQFHTSGNAKIGGNLIISGNLTVNGTLTYLNVEDLAVEDPLIKLAKDNTANTLDIGFFGKYVATGTKYKGLFNDASDDKFKLFISTGTEPTTTVDTTASGYAVGTLVANLEGNVTGGTISGTTGSFSGLVTGIAPTSDLNFATKKYVDDQTIPTPTLSSVLSAGNSSGANDLKIIDDQKLLLGDDGDMQIYHNQVNSVFFNDTGNIVFRNNANDSDISFQTDDGLGYTTEYLRIDGGTENIVFLKPISGTTASFSGLVTGIAPTSDLNFATKKYVDDQTTPTPTLSSVLGVGNTSGDNEIIMADDKAILFGTGGDSFIKHTGSAFSLINDLGNTTFTNRGDNTDIIFESDNGSGGTIEYFRVDGGATRVIFGKSIQVTDNVNIFLGNSTTNTDGYIKWDSTASQIFIGGESKFLNNLYVVGNLGVGTGTADSPIHVNKGGLDTSGQDYGVHIGVLESGAGRYSAIELVSNGALSGWIDFSNTDSANDYNERIRGGAGVLDFYTNTTLAVSISNAQHTTFKGNVYIQDTSTLSTLELQENSTHWGRLHYMHSDFTTSGTNIADSLLLVASGESTGGIVIRSDKAGSEIVFAIGSQTADIVMKITDGANGVEFFPTSTAEGGHIALRADTNGSYRYAIDNYNDTLRIIRQDDADSANGSVLSVFDENGDLTIQRDLIANRTGYFKNNDSSRVLYLDQTAANSGGIVQFRNEADVNTWELVGRNNQFYIYNNGLSRQSIYIEPTNNFIGINNNTTPKAFLHVTDGTNGYPTDANNKLVVESDGHTYIGLGSGNASDAGIHFGDSTAVNRGRLAYIHSEDAMKISTNGAVRYILDGGGNVGYNSAVKPSTGSWRNFGFGSLRMFGRSDANNPDGGIGTNFYFTTANAELRVSAHAASRIRFDDDQILFDNAGTGLINSTITWNNRMFINASGYLGVGATTAIAQLHVDAKDTPYDNASGLAVFQDNADRQIVIGGLGLFRRDANSNADLRMNWIGYNGGITQPRDLDIYDGKKNLIAQFIGSTKNVHITTKLGIGIAVPTQKLQVDGGATGLAQGIPATSGTTQNGILRLTSGSATYGETLDIGMNVGTTYAWIQATNKGNLAIDYNLALNPNGGNVGVGMSTPERRMVLDGTLGTASLEIKQNSDRIVYLGTGSSTDNVDQPILLLYDAGAIKVNISSIATSYLTGGNLAIGATTANAKIKVLGDAASNGISIQSAGNGGTYPFMVTWAAGAEGDAFCIDDNLNCGIGTNSPNYDLEVYGTDAQMFAHYPSNSRGGIMALATQRVAFTTTGSADDLVFGYNSSTSVSSANFVERMRIDNGTGLVTAEESVQVKTAIRVFGNNVTDISATNSPTTTSANIGTYANAYSFIDLSSSNASGGWIDFSNANGTDYGGRIRYNFANSRMSFSAGTGERFRVNVGTTTALNTLEAAGATYSVLIGGASFSWAGSTNYPTIYGSAADRWVMYTNPHIVWLQNGVNGYTGSSSGAKIRFAGESSYTQYWDAGVNIEYSVADHYSIGRSGAVMQLIYPPNSTWSGLASRDWTVFGSGSRAGGIVINDIAGANYGIYAGGYDLTFSKSVNGTSVQPALSLLGDNTADSTPDVRVHNNFDVQGTAYIANAATVVSNASSRVLYLKQNAVSAGNIVQFQDQSSTNTWEVVGRNNIFYIYNNMNGQGYAFYINPTNNYIGINKSSAGYNLDVAGTIRATADVIAYSDRRVKENIITIDNALDKVTKLRGVTYTRKDIDDKSTKIGVIAQEVLEVLPEVVEKDNEGKYSVAYGNMAGVFIEAIKELENRIKELENKSCNCK